MTYIGDLFNKYGSDKDSNHSYGPFYQNLFTDPSKVERVMEIGIAHGGSVLAFRDFFPNAQVVGFDKEPCHRAETGSEDAEIYPITPRPERLEIHQGDMRVREDLIRAVNHRQFDMVIDDATHLLPDNLCCLLWMWPWVKPGGVYVIEECYNVQELAPNIVSLFVGAEVWKSGPPIADELLVLIRKPLA